MAIYEETVDDTLYIAERATVYTEDTAPYYGNIVSGNNYFRTKLNARDWFDAEPDMQINALRAATALIEALNFDGEKVDAAQTLHFPTVEHETPRAIYVATYEVALKLLEGYDPDREVKNLMASSQGFAGFKTTYHDRTSIQENVRAGIPSAYAWSILRPYLCDPLRLKLCRGE